MRGRQEHQRQREGDVTAEAVLWRAGSEEAAVLLEGRGRTTNKGPLEAAKGDKVGSPLEPPERVQPC